MNWPELETLLTDGIAPQGRKIHIYTGLNGFDMVSHAFAVENSVGFVEWMKEKERIDFDTAQNLINMLRSPDKENFNIAILAIEHLRQ
jgi:alpha-D-ribose 1-methylphosphonate 5-triphosphate synthase subunit PhnI